jgi:hypothetical protein
MKKIRSVFTKLAILAMLIAGNMALSRDPVVSACGEGGGTGGQDGEAYYDSACTANESCIWSYCMCGSYYDSTCTPLRLCAPQCS